jgi:hypothetical protein
MAIGYGHDDRGVGFRVPVKSRKSRSMTDPYGRILGFLDRSCYFFLQVAPSCNHEAEWTPFQTHYFSENLVVPGIEPEPLDELSNKPANISRNQN